MTVSQAAVRTILAQAFRDQAFAARLKATPDLVLDPFDLTDAERASILAGLRSAGGGAPLDQRPRLAGRIV